MQRQWSSFVCFGSQKKMDNFFLKGLKENTETTEQEQNVSLSSRETISTDPFAFKGFPFPTNTMTKTQSLFHILNSNKLNHQQ